MHPGWPFVQGSSRPTKRSEDVHRYANADPRILAQYQVVVGRQVFVLMYHNTVLLNQVSVGGRYLERREWLAAGQVVVWMLHLARDAPGPFVAAVLLTLALLFPVSSCSARSATTHRWRLHDKTN